MAVTEGLQLSPKNAFELIRRARAGESLKQLSKEFSVPEEEIKQLIGKKASNLTLEERKKRNELILQEFVNNPERCQEGRLRSFCEELGTRYNLSWRQVYRLFKQKELEINGRRTKTTDLEITVASFESCESVKEWVKRLRRGEGCKKLRVTSINLYVERLKRMFADYALVGEPNTDPLFWEYEKISDLMDIYENVSKIETYNLKGAYNSFTKVMELQRKTFRRSIVTNGSYRPGRIKPKKPLNSAELKKVYDECFNLYGVTKEDVRFFLDLLPDRFSIDELDSMFLKEVLKKEKNFTFREFQFWKKNKRQPVELQKRFPEFSVNVLNKRMKKVENAARKLKKRFENVKKAMNLYCCLKMMATTGLRHGSREKTHYITKGEKLTERAHGLEGLRFKDWNFNEERWKFTISEKWHDWINVPILKSVQDSLEKYFRLLSKEEKALDQYCFKTSRLKRDMIELTVRCGLGEYKETWFVREKVKGRRKMLYKEVPEGTPGATFGKLRDEDDDYVMLWGRHLHAHLLRSSFATICYREKGLTLEQIAVMGHWKNLQTLWERYIVYDEKELYKNMEKLESVLGHDFEEGF